MSYENRTWDAGNSAEEENGRLQRAEEQSRPGKEKVACIR